jgi:hypothetical protein
MRLVMTSAAALALVLAGCNKAPSEKPANNAAAANASGPKVDYVAEIRAMDPPLRRGTFLRAIRDAGQPCQEVRKEYETEPVGGQASWSAECDNGAQWIVIVQRDGNAKVTNAVNPKPLAPVAAATGRP